MTLVSGILNPIKNQTIFWFQVFIDEGGFTFKFSTFNPALCK